MSMTGRTIKRLQIPLIVLSIAGGLYVFVQGIIYLKVQGDAKTAAIVSTMAPEWQELFHVIERAGNRADEVMKGQLSKTDDWPPLTVKQFNALMKDATPTTYTGARCGNREIYHPLIYFLDRQSDFQYTQLHDRN